MIQIYTLNGTEWNDLYPMLMRTSARLLAIALRSRACYNIAVLMCLRACRNFLIDILESEKLYASVNNF